MEKKRYGDPLDGLGGTGVSGSDRDLLNSLGTSIRSDVDVETIKKGALFANRYEILSEGKKGGMGEVYKCKDKKLDSIKALKLIRPRLLNSDDVVKRFQQEVAISQSLYHKNIVRVYDIDEHEGIEFFTMEWIEGKSLREILIQRKKEKRPFTLLEAYEIVSQLADALDHAHKKTIHRDIKPENILLSEGEEGIQIKLTDFGIAKMLTPSQFMVSSQQMGTPYYMAPEQKEDAARVDKRADIYAMGVVLFELLTFENTIGFKLPSEINRTLPKEIDEIVKKAMATKPEDRYEEVRHFSGALSRLVGLGRRKGGEITSTAGIGPQVKDAEKQQVIEKKRSVPFKKVSIGITLLAVAIAGVVYISNLRREVSIPVKPVTPDVIRNLRLGDNKTINLVDPRKATFFNPITGEPQVWYYLYPDGAFEFYDKPGYHPITGEPLKAVTKEVYFEWREKEKLEVDPAKGKDEQKKKEQQQAMVKRPGVDEKERRLNEFKSLINQSVATYSDKLNVAVVIDSLPTGGGLSPGNKLVILLKKDKVNLIDHYFKEAIRTKGYFREIYGGDTEILNQSGALSKIDYIIIGKIDYIFRKGVQVDKDLISCNISFNYKVIDKNGRIVKSDSINVVGPGFSEDAALERGLEMLVERYSDRILTPIS